MDWLEMTKGSGVSGVDAERAKVLDMAREEKLPVIEKEAATGVKPVEPMKFQPVHSPGIYESEFGSKGEDLIFHFWPWGYHKADRNEERTPKFAKDFLVKLTTAMTEIFDGRVVIEEDKDMGAFFVRCTGWASNQFARELAIKACKKLHTDLGGAEG